MLYISRWKATAILATASARLPVRGSQFLPEGGRRQLAQMGAAPHRARPRPAGRLAHPARSRFQRRAQGKDRAAARRCPPGRAREQARQRRRRWRCAATPSSSAFARASISKLALQKFQELSQPLGGLLAATGQRTVDVVDARHGLFRLTVTEPALVERIRQSVEQSIQIIERRVNELGTVEPSIRARASTACWCRCRGCRILRGSRNCSARPPS